MVVSDSSAVLAWGCLTKVSRCRRQWVGRKVRIKQKALPVSRPAAMAESGYLARETTCKTDGPVVGGAIVHCKVTLAESSDELGTVVELSAMAKMSEAVAVRQTMRQVQLPRHKQQESAAAEARGDKVVLSKLASLSYGETVEAKTRATVRQRRAAKVAERPQHRRTV